MGTRVHTPDFLTTKDTKTTKGSADELRVIEFVEGIKKNTKGQDSIHDSLGLTAQQTPFFVSFVLFVVGFSAPIRTQLQVTTQNSEEPVFSLMGTRVHTPDFLTTKG
jgi:hypothetical protein